MRFDASLVTWLLAPKSSNHWGSVENCEIGGNAYDNDGTRIWHYGYESMGWKLNYVAFLE